MKKDLDHNKDSLSSQGYGAESPESCKIATQSHFPNNMIILIKSECRVFLLGCRRLCFSSHTNFGYITIEVFSTETEVN